MKNYKAIADMKTLIIRVGLVVCLLYVSWAPVKNRPRTEGAGDLPASALYPYGRYLQNAGGDVELIGSAVHFGFSFTGKECRVYAYINDSTGHNYLQYELDGVYQKRIRVSGNDRRPLVIALPAQGQGTGAGGPGAGAEGSRAGGQDASGATHTVWIYKATEAQTGPIFIGKIGGKNLKPLKSPEAPVIEFIGNSITCGAASDPSETPCGTGVYHDQHNAYYAYGPRVARALGANYIMSSVSGIGIYRNWNSDGPTMPQVYEKADLLASSPRRWDFGKYRPAIVSIALGTNDYSNGDGRRERAPFDSAVFVSTYIKFVQLVKSKYPGTQIALLSSPMINGDRRIQLQNCLSAVKEKIDALYPAGKRVALFFFLPMHARGCGGHPNVEDHAILAEELEPFFKKLL